MKSFQIGNANEPNTPFVTVAYSLKKSIKYYGEYAHKPNDSILEYVNTKLCKQIIKKI